MRVRYDIDSLIAVNLKPLTFVYRVLFFFVHKSFFFWNSLRYFTSWVYQNIVFCDKKQKGPVEQNVFDRGLVVRDPKSLDIVKEFGLYYKNTKERKFSGEVLGYITPVRRRYCKVMKLSKIHGREISLFISNFSGTTKVWK